MRGRARIQSEFSAGRHLERLTAIYQDVRRDAARQAGASRS
jgi:hypothetical protein